MKKLLGIVVLGLLLASSNLFAESSKLNKFNQWLSENGYHQYINLEQNPVCKEEPKYSQAWYLQNCDKFQGSNNLCLLYTSPSPRDGLLSRMPSSA